MCALSAQYYGMKSRNADHPTPKQLGEEAAAFFRQAAERVDFVVYSLRSEWGKNAPTCADGDLLRWMARMYDVNRQSLLDRIQKITDLFDDPTTPVETRRQATSSFAEELKGTTWASQETGAPTYEIGENLYKLALAVDDRTPLRASGNRFWPL